MPKHNSNPEDKAAEGREIAVSLLQTMQAVSDNLRLCTEAMNSVAQAQQQLASEQRQLRTDQLRVEQQRLGQHRELLTALASVQEQMGYLTQVVGSAQGISVVPRQSQSPLEIGLSMLNGALNQNQPYGHF